MRPEVATRCSLDVVQCTRWPGLAGFEVFRAHWFETSFPPHQHDFYAVSWNESGRGAFDCRGELRDARPGTCNLIAPGEVHTGRATSPDGWAYRNLYLDPSRMRLLLAGVGRDRGSDVRFRSPLVCDPVLAACLAWAFAALATPTSQLEMDSQLLPVAARLVTDHVVDGEALPGTGRERLAVRRVREWLDAHSDHNVSLAELAALAGLSPYTLVRAFGREVGVPPHRYQTCVRVNRARRLLAAGETIVDVVYQTGFCDQSHLTRSFKRLLGVTPGRYAAPRGADRASKPIPAS